MKRVLAVCLLAAMPALAQEAGETVEVRIEDYDPTIQQFALRPTKDWRIMVAFRPVGDQGDWPNMLQRVGDKVKCEMFRVRVGTWRDLEGKERPLHQSGLRCGTEDDVREKAAEIAKRNYGAKLEKLPPATQAEIFEIARRHAIETFYVFDIRVTSEEEYLEMMKRRLREASGR